MEELLAQVPAAGKYADLTLRSLASLDSTNVAQEHWIALIETVAEAHASFDGVLVLHGTDTMAYTASALAFLLPGLDRPVVLTGAQKPLTAVRTDARTNLIDACQVATMCVPEVGVVFSSRLFRGCRATKLDAWSMDAFGSPSCPPLAELGLGVQLAPHVLP